MDKSTHEEHLSQLLKTNKKQFKISVTFPTDYNGIFKVTNSYTRFNSKKTITDGDNFIQTTIPPCADEIESLNNEIRRIIIDKGHYSENEQPFTIKLNFSTLGSVIELSPQRPIISFVFNDSIRIVLGFHETILYKECNPSPNPVDILSFDNIFLENDNAKRMIFKGRRSGIIHNWTMTVYPGYKYEKKLCGRYDLLYDGIRDVTSSICFKLKNENNELISFNAQSIFFGLSIKEI